MDSGVFIVSHQIYSSAVHVIMMLALVPPNHLLFPSKPYWMLFKGIVIIHVYLHQCNVDWRKCFCVVIWLGIGSDLCSNDPCWEVLQEQIWRCYPVNKEPAETSCKATQLADVWFQANPAQARQLVICVSLSFFIVIEDDTEEKNALSEIIQEKLKVDVHFY